MTTPKYLTSHPAVSEVEYMLEQSGGAYRWGVYLKPGWIFENSRNAGGRSLNINNKADFVWANPVREPEPATIKNSANTLRRGYGPGYPTPHWAKKAPVTVAVDQIHKYLIVGADVDRLKAYCAAVAGTHGAGNCDIYEFPEHDKRLRDIIDFLHADDCAIMHFDYRGQLMPGAGTAPSVPGTASL